MAGRSAAFLYVVSHPIDIHLPIRRCFTVHFIKGTTDSITHPRILWSIPHRAFHLSEPLGEIIYNQLSRLFMQLL